MAAKDPFEKRTRIRVGSNRQSRRQQRGMLIIGLLALVMLGGIIATASVEPPIKLNLQALPAFPRLADRIYVVGSAAGATPESRNQSQLIAFDTLEQREIYSFGGSNDALLSPDGSQLYVLSDLELRAHAAWDGGLGWRTSLEQPQFSHGPPTMLVAPDGRTVYVARTQRNQSNLVQRSLLVIDAQTGQLNPRPIPLPNDAHTGWWLIAPDGSRLYFVQQSGIVLVINPTTAQVEARLVLPNGAAGAALAHDGRRLYVLTDSHDLRLTELDLATNTFGAPRVLGALDQHSRIGGLLLLGPASGQIAVGTFNLSQAPFSQLRLFDLASGHEVRRIASDLPLNWDQVALNRTGQRIFAASAGGLRNDNQVLSFDLTSGEPTLTAFAPQDQIARLLVGPAQPTRRSVPALGFEHPVQAPAPPRPRTLDDTPLAYIQQFYSAFDNSFVPGEIFVVDHAGQVEQIATYGEAIIERPGMSPLLITRPNSLTIGIVDASSPAIVSFTLDPYTELRRPVLSPDQRSLLWIAETDPTPQDGEPGEVFLLLADSQTGAIQKLNIAGTTLKSADSPTLFWLKDGIYLYVIGDSAVFKAPPGAKTLQFSSVAPISGYVLDGTVTGLILIQDLVNGQLGVLDISSGQRQVISKEPRFDLGHARIAPDGRTVALLRPESAVADSKSFELFVYDIEQASGASWATGLRPTQINPLRWSSSGQQLMMTSVNSSSSLQEQAHLLLFDGLSGQLLDKRPHSSTRIVDLSSDGYLVSADSHALSVNNQSLLEIYDLQSPNDAPIMVPFKQGFFGTIYAP